MSSPSFRPESAPEPVESASVPPTSSKRAPVWLWPNLLSLDAPIIAVLWLWLFSVALKIRLVPWHIYLVLGLVVWVVYSLDRVIDGWRLEDDSRATQRHRFHRRFAAPLLAMIALVAVAAVGLALLRIPQIVFFPGVRIAIFVGAYFAYRFAVPPRHQVFPKEFFCGIIFAFGSTFPVYEFSTGARDMFASMELWLFALLCSVNCLAIALWEWQADRSNDAASASSRWRGGDAKLIVMLLILVAAALTRFAMTVPGYGWPIPLCVAISALGLLLLHLLRGRLGADLLRVMADAALLSPLLVGPWVKW